MVILIRDATFFAFAASEFMYSCQVILSGFEEKIHSAAEKTTPSPLVVQVAVEPSLRESSEVPEVVQWN